MQFRSLFQVDLLLIASLLLGTPFLPKARSSPAPLETQYDAVENAFFLAAPTFVSFFTFIRDKAALEALRTQLGLSDTNLSPQKNAQRDLIELLSVDKSGFEIATIRRALELYADGFLPQEIWDFGLTKIEAAALYLYTTEDYQELNPELRQPSPRPEALSYAAMINRALSRLPKFRGLVKRGLSLPEDQLPLYREGSEISLPSFTSATADLMFGAFERKHRFLIESQCGRDVSSFSSNPGEREVLFAAGSKFRVLEVRRDVDLHGFRAEIEFHLTEIGCDSK